MHRIQMQSQREGIITADWIKYWNLNVRLGNPPYPAGITERMGCLWTYATDAAYGLDNERQNQQKCTKDAYTEHYGPWKLRYPHHVYATGWKLSNLVTSSFELRYNICN